MNGATKAATLWPMPNPNNAEMRLKALYGHQDASRPDQRVAVVAAEQWGVVSLTDLRNCGLTHKAVRTRLRSGRLHRLYEGVYAVGHPALPLEGLFLAAVKAWGDGAVLSHFSAAAFWGLVDWDGRHPEVTIPRSVGGNRPGIRVHRSGVLESRDLTIRQGIPVTMPARTLIDLAAVVDQRQLRRAVRQALSLKRVRMAQLGEVLARLRPRRGCAKLALVLADGHMPTRSELEDVVLELILRAGFEPPEVNVPLRIGGRFIIPDFRWPEQKLVVEADGATWHDNKLAREDDAERQALLESHGERVVRVTWGQALKRGPQTLERLRAAGAPALVAEMRFDALYGHQGASRPGAAG